MSLGKILAILAGVACIGYFALQALSVPRAEYLIGGLVFGVLPIWLLPIIGAILTAYGWFFL